MTNVTFKFEADSVASIATKIGSGSFTPATLSANTLSFSLPEGTTNFAVAYTCVTLITGSGSSQVQTNEQYLEEATLDDGTSYLGYCPANPGVLQTGTLNYSIDASGIAGANGLSIQASSGNNYVNQQVNTVTASGSLEAVTGNDSVVVLAEEENGSFLDSYLLAVREYASQAVPGSLDEGNVVTLDAADQTTPQSITYQNVPIGFTGSISASYLPSGGAPAIPLVINWGPAYPEVPASIATAGGYYNFSASSDGPAVSVGGAVSVQETNNGGPISIVFPTPWVYSGPTPAALPTFDYSSYTETTGTTRVSRDAQVEWSASSGSVFNSYLIEATANAMNGSNSLAMPDLSGLAGFLTPPTSGTSVFWWAAINQSNYQVTRAQSSGDALSQATNGGFFQVP